VQDSISDVSVHFNIRSILKTTISRLITLIAAFLILASCLNNFKSKVVRKIKQLSGQKHLLKSQDFWSTLGVQISKGITLVILGFFDNPELNRSVFFKIKVRNGLCPV